MKVTVARIYVTEGERIHAKILKRLHDEEQVQGVTVFRGITGFGKSGRIHSSALLDMSMDLPVVIEFFDAPDKVERVLMHLLDTVQPGHVLTFPADLR
jgi:PII-like signaling protein